LGFANATNKRFADTMYLLRRGADIRHIQEFLGHARLDTTKVYLRLVPGHLKEDYDEAMPEIDVRV
jgi:site-specific recombinase XerD